MKCWILLLLIGLLAIFFCAGRAQDQPANRKGEEILFNISVTDEKAEWIAGLRKDAFKVFYNKQLQTIVSFVPGGVPASIGVLIDTSGSTVRVLLSALPAGIDVLAKQSDPANDYFIISFDEKPKLLLDCSQDVKAVKEVVENLRHFKPKGNTKLYDSIQIGINKLAKAKNGKRVLIVFTDTHDNVSKTGRSAIRRMIEESGVLVYTINVSDPDQFYDDFSKVDMRVMEDLTNASGGRYFLPKGPVELNKALSWIANDLRNQYLIGLQPVSKSESGSEWRRIEIKVDLPQDSKTTGKATIRTKRGYHTQSKAN